MSHPANDILFEQLRDFMEGRGLTENDIMQDERGKYYMSQDNDTGEMHKMYLPLNFQELV